MESVSVVIPTFNRNGIVQKAIDSALAQTHPPDEIIVVDDGSDDGTRDALQSYGEKICYLYQSNAGVSAARNAGILAAKGEWIAFLDSDDEWLPIKLEAHAQHVRGRNDLVAFASNCSVIRADQPSLNLFHFRGAPEGVDESGVIERPLQSVLRGRFLTPTIVARRDRLLQIGLLDVQMSMCEDMDFMARLALQGPWAIDERDLVRILRQGDPKENLTQLEIDRPLYVAECRLRLYAKLMGRSELTPDEARFVRKQLAGSRLSMAAAHLQAGNRQDGRRCIIRACRDSLSPKSFIKAGLSLVLGEAGIRLVKSIECRRSPQLWR